MAGAGAGAAVVVNGPPFCPQPGAWPDLLRVQWLQHPS
jgi:hypothetical protein